MSISLSLSTNSRASGLQDFEAVKALVSARVTPLKSAARIGFAQSFCAEILSILWKLKLDGFKSKWRIRKVQGNRPLPASERGLVKEIVVPLENLPSQQIGYLVGSLYTSLLPREYRSQLGAYYTPPALVDRLLQNVTDMGYDWPNGSVLDPACGGAAFLAPVGKKIASELGADGADARTIIKVISERVRGIEIDAFAAWMSMVLLELELLDICVQAKTRLPELIAVGDALKLCTCQKQLFGKPKEHHFDLVIGNPPYGRVTLSPELRNKFQRSLFGHANLYGLFTDLALRLTQEGAIVAYVTPTSFLGGQYFKRLRKALSEEAPPRVVDFVTQRTGVFDEVLQETVLVLFKRSKNYKSKVLLNSVTPNGFGTPVNVEKIGAFHLHTRNNGNPWLFPRNRSQRNSLLQALLMKHRLSDYGFSVATGQLVWNRHKDQIKATPGENRLPLIWAEAVTQAGGFQFTATKREHKPYFQLEKQQQHLVTKKPCVIVQRTTAKEQSRRVIAAVLPQEFLDEQPAGVVIENHLNIVRAVASRARISLEVLAALFNSRAVDSLFRCINGSVAVSAYELNAIPLPDPERINELSLMIEEKHDSQNIEEYINGLYGLMNE